MKWIAWEIYEDIPKGFPEDIRRFIFIYITLKYLMKFPNKFLRIFDLVVIFLEGFLELLIQLLKALTQKNKNCKRNFLGEILNKQKQKFWANSSEKKLEKNYLFKTFSKEYQEGLKNHLQVFIEYVFWKCFWKISANAFLFLRKLLRDLWRNPWSITGKINLKESLKKGLIKS